MIPRNQNHLHILRNLPDKLGREPILLIDIRHLQINLLPLIHPNPIHKITSDQNIPDTVGNLPLVRITHLAPKPAEDPLERVLQEHLATNVDIRDENRVDLLTSPAGPVIGNLRQHNILRHQQLPRTLPRLQEQDLVSGHPPGRLPQPWVRIVHQHGRFLVVIVHCQKDPIPLLPLLHDHTDKPSTTIRAGGQRVCDRPSTPSIDPLPKQAAHLLKPAAEIPEKIIKDARRPQFSRWIKDYLKPRLMLLSKTTPSTKARLNLRRLVRGQLQLLSRPENQIRADEQRPRLDRTRHLQQLIDERPQRFFPAELDESLERVRLDLEACLQYHSYRVTQVLRQADSPPEPPYSYDDRLIPLSSSVSLSRNRQIRNVHRDLAHPVQ